MEVTLSIGTFEIVEPTVGDLSNVLHLVSKKGLIDTFLELAVQATQVPAERDALAAAEVTPRLLSIAEPLFEHLPEVSTAVIVGVLRHQDGSRVAKEQAEELRPSDIEPLIRGILSSGIFDKLAGQLKNLRSRVTIGPAPQSSTQ